MTLTGFLIVMALISVGLIMFLKKLPIGIIIRKEALMEWHP
jgi:hypothetical protein